ncbi:MAG: CBS domain-containing protein, partial [Bacteroidales bacterium]|nr:CBS domain-containing protein [Bacteroidales bacterium]
HWKPVDILVEEFMETDVFTVHPDDVIELVIDMMDWSRIRYVPVEDEKGKMVGLVTARLLLRYLRKNIKKVDTTKINIEEIMIREPIVVKPDDKISVAIDLMDKNQIGCLPVIKNNELVGIVTEAEFFRLSKRLFDRMR